MWLKFGELAEAKAAEGEFWDNAGMKGLFLPGDRAAEPPVSHPKLGPSLTWSYGHCCPPRKLGKPHSLIRLEKV